VGLGTVYKRIALVGSLTLGLLFTPLATEAQQSAKVYRIGTLSVSSAESASLVIINAFEEDLKALGYVRGSNVIYEHRFAGGRTERLPALAKELAALNLDVVVAGANAAIAAARQSMPRIPIVMGYAIDPVGVGFVMSLAHPGGNITVVTYDVTADTWGKRPQLAREIVPLVSQVAVLWNPDSPGMSALGRQRRTPQERSA